MNLANLKPIQELLAKPNLNVLILTHANPDLDAIGSSLALGLALDELNISNRIVIDQSCTLDYQFLPQVQQKIKLDLEWNADINTVFCIDTANFERLNHVDFVRNNRDNVVVVNIDHHISNTNYGDLNLIEDVSAVGELLFNFFQELNIPVNNAMAQCLYTSIIADTGCFRYINATADTFLVAAKLIQLGANNCKLAQAVFESKKYSIFEVYKIALNNLTVDNDLGFAYTFLPYSQEDFGQEVIDFIRVIKDVNVFLVFRQYQDNLIRISLRSKDNIDIAKFANIFDGGGHKAAAGIKLKGDLHAVQDKVISALKSYLHQYYK
jgi:phosphoesterase RecJ-like protein